jgi:hypothetical protein
MKIVLCLFTLAVSCLTVFAQDTPKLETHCNYSHAQFDPTASKLQSAELNIRGGLQVNFALCVAASRIEAGDRVWNGR